MTWHPFFAASEDFPALLDVVITELGATIYETYSRLAESARTFASGRAAAESLKLGHDPAGKGVATMVSLWIPSTMRRPTIRTYAVRTRAGSPPALRDVVEGCGLFTLHCGGEGPGIVPSSQLGLFTERMAYRQCAVEPGPDAVDWLQHKRAARLLLRCIRRASSGRRGGKVSVLPHAARLAMSGSRLLAGPGTQREVVPDARDQA